MPTPLSFTREASQLTARNALDFVCRYNLQATTHPNFLERKKQERDQDLQLIIQARNTADYYPTYDVGPDKVLSRLDRMMQEVVSTRLANCGENAFMAVDYIARFTEDYAEAFTLGIDHTI